MIKTYSRRKLGRSSSHRKLLLRNLATSLIMNEKIITSYPKAKELQRFIEKIITIAKNTDFNAKREIARYIMTREAKKKLFNVLIQRFSQRKSGYTQIFKLEKTRRGDNATLGLIKLIQ